MNINCEAYLAEACLTSCQSSRLSFIFINICGVVCVQLAHFSLGDWEDISIDHVIIIIESEESTLPIIIFFRGCVPEMFVTSYSVTYCIYIPGKPGFCFHYYGAVCDACKYSETFWLAGNTGDWLSNYPEFHRYNRHDVIMRRCSS